MQDRRANAILQALVHGVHPYTGEPLPSDSVVQDPGVIRALLSGMTALNAVEARAARRAQLPKNVGLPWTELELASVRREFEGGQPIEEIARAHGRSARAITHRLAMLGLVAESDPSLGFVQPAGPRRERSGGNTRD